jgi:hypothetical protein
MAPQIAAQKIDRRKMPYVGQVDNLPHIGAPILAYKCARRCHLLGMNGRWRGFGPMRARRIAVRQGRRSRWKCALVAMGFVETGRARKTTRACCDRSG